MGMGGSASTPTCLSSESLPVLWPHLPGVRCPNSTGRECFKGQKRQMPLRLCLTDASCRRPPFPRVPVPPQPLSLHGSPWSCCLWTLEGLESQNDLQGAPGLAFPVTGRKTEPQQDEGMELGPLTNTQADHCLPHLFLFPASVQRPQAPPDAAVKRRRMGPGLGHRVLL